MGTVSYYLLTLIVVPVVSVFIVLTILGAFVGLVAITEKALDRVKRWANDSTKSNKRKT